MESVADDFPTAIYELVSSQFSSALRYQITLDQLIERLRDPLLIQETKLGLEKKGGV